MMYEMLTGKLPVGRFDPPAKNIRVTVGTREQNERFLELLPAALGVTIAR